MDVSLRDIALAVSMPIDESEFEELCESGESDFVRHLSTGFPWGERTLLWKHYEHGFASYARDVLDRLGALGVTVRRKATANDFGRLLGEHALVGLIAHHPCPPFVAADVERPDEVLRILTEVSDGPLLELRAFAKGDALAIDGSREGLAALMNRALEAAASNYDIVAEDRKPTTFETSFEFSRMWIEHRFRGSVRRGPCIELWRMFLSLDELENVLPASYRGVLDLIVCNSALHAELLKDRFPLATFWANVARARVGARLARFSAMVSILTRYKRVNVKDLLKAATLASGGG